MELLDAVKQRHSVRKYKEQPLGKSVKAVLQRKIDECNNESGLHIQLVTDEPKAFSGKIAHYGSFSGVTNYIAIVGKRSADLEEKSGYYGEKLVLFAQQLGLNTCWVALTYSKIKGAYEVKPGEKLVIVIALGYGDNQGGPHKSKTIDQVCKVQGEMPDWFKNGMEAVLLAPTAINQQKFTFTFSGKCVKAKAGIGPCSKIDLGIAKYHFEIGAGKEKFKWG